MQAALPKHIVFNFKRHTSPNSQSTSKSTKPANVLVSDFF